jgi:hypothetical protein
MSIGTSESIDFSCKLELKFALQAQQIPIEIYQEILERSEFLSQIRLTQLCKYFHDNLKIYDFCDIDIDYIYKLSDNVLKTYKYIKKLKLWWSGNVTDNGIMHLNLHTLIASYHHCNITDKGIKHMKLHTLKVEDNVKITDDGIKHMNLYSLDASANSKITDAGVKHMNLHILYARWNPKITDAGVKHLNLHTLYAPFILIPINFGEPI